MIRVWLSFLDVDKYLITHKGKIPSNRLFTVPYFSESSWGGAPTLTVGHLYFFKCTECQMHWGDGCLVPRSHYSTRPKSFGSRGPSESLKRIDRKGVGKRRTVTLTRSDIYTQHEGGAPPCLSLPKKKKKKTKNEHSRL